MLTFFCISDTYKPFFCKAIIEGIYHYTYELKGAFGMCDNRKSMIRSCQAAGSELRDNILLKKTEGWCAGLTATGNTVAKGTLQEDWRCYGVWTDPNGNIKAALRIDTNDDKFRFRCMLRTIDQIVKVSTINPRLSGTLSNRHFGPYTKNCVSDVSPLL